MVRIASRPAMPASYGIKPRDDGEGLIAWERIEDRLTGSRNYWVCTTRSEGRPHAMPVWGLWLDGAFYFSTDPKSQKGRNIRERPSLVVHLESGDDVVIIEGTAAPVVDGAEARRVAEAYLAKFDIGLELDNPNYGVYRVTPKVVFGWLEKDFPSSATRWTFGAR